MNLYSGSGGCCGAHPSGDCTDSEMASCGLMNLAIAADIDGNIFKKASTIVDKFKKREVIVKKNTFDSKSTIDLGLMNLYGSGGCCGRHPSGDCTDNEMASCGLMNLAVAAEIDGNIFKKDSTIVDKFKKREVIV